jgi:hypothetical protein
MEKKVALFLALVLSALLTFAQDKSGGLIEGNTWAFLISAPDGWVWDSASLCHQGIQGLFYKAGSTFSPSKLHMYISPSQKKPNGPATLSEFIETDEAAFMRFDPGNLVMDLSPYSTSMEYSFLLRDFDDQNERYYQSIAYYEGEEAYFVFVLFCRSALERDRTRASFLELLDSFTYIRKE